MIESVNKRRESNEQEITSQVKDIERGYDWYYKVYFKLPEQL